MKKIVLFGLFLSLCISMTAQNVSALLIPTDARTLSLGNVILADDPGRLGVDALFSIWSPGIISNTIIGGEVSYRIGQKFILSADAYNFKDKPYAIADSFGTVKGEFAPSDLYVSLGGRFFAGEALSFGVKGRILNSKLSADISESAFCGDVTVSYSKPSFSVTAAACNVGTKAALARVNGAFTGVRNLVAAVEADYLFNGGIMAGVGAEYWFADIVALRAGFHYGDKEKALPTYASVGLGAKFKGVALNASYLLASETLGGTMMFGLGYSF